MKFTTNIKCGGCVASVKPHLDAHAGIHQWEVDLQDPDRTLSISSCDLTADEVVAAVKKAGFVAEEIR